MKKIINILLSIKEGIVFIYNHKIFVWIRGTLTYNIAKIFIIIIILLRIIFYISPSDAFISYEPEQIDEINIEARIINADLRPNKFFLTAHNYIVFFINDNIIVNDIKYDNTYQLIVKNETVPAYMQFENVEQEEMFVNLLLRDSTTSDSLDKETFSFQSNRNNSKITFKTQYGFKLTILNDVRLSFEKNKAYLTKEGCEDIPVTNCVLSSFSEISSDGEAKFEIYNLDDDNYIGHTGIRLFNIKEANFKSTGEIGFSYSPNPKKYDIYDQILNIKTNETNLDMTLIYINKDTFAYINGTVNEVFLSNMSLLPNFNGWYRENIYLIPLTLITAIFGGVTLMVNLKKKKRIDIEYK